MNKQIKKIKLNEEGNRKPCFLFKKKRHFQLLELMIAAFILLVCIVPTMRIFTKMYVSQQEMIRENQRDHLAHLVHAHVVEQLYKRNIVLKNGMDESIHIDNQELTELLKKHAYGIQGTLEVIDREPQIKEPAKKYLVKIRFELKDASQKKGKKEPQTPIVFDYLVYIKADPSEKTEDKGKKTEKNKDEAKEKENEVDGKNQMNTPTQSPKPAPMAPKKNETKNRHD